MWNRKSWLLYVRVKLRDGRRSPLNLLLPLALFVPYQLMLAYSGLLSLLPGDFGRKARLAADTIHAMLLHLMYADPQSIADVDLRDQDQRVRVIVRTVGFEGGERP